MRIAFFGALTEERQAVVALSGIREHVRAGGLLLFDVWQWLPDYFVAYTERTAVIGENRVRREGVTIDEARRNAKLWYEFQVDDDQRWHESFEVRAYRPDELGSLRVQAGLVVEEIRAAYTAGSSPAGAPRLR